MGDEETRYKVIYDPRPTNSTLDEERERHVEIESEGIDEITWCGMKYRMVEVM